MKSTQLIKATLGGQVENTEHPETPELPEPPETTHQDAPRYPQSPAPQSRHRPHPKTRKCRRRTAAALGYASTVHPQHPPQALKGKNYATAKTRDHKIITCDAEKYKDRSIRRLTNVVPFLSCSVP